MLKFYNSLTKKIENFVPINPPKVNIYICGPTVYDYFHIGNARTFTMSDVIRRYLEYRGYEVNYVMNLTDIDDKLIKKAQDEKTDTAEVAKKYIDAFFEDSNQLKIKTANLYPRATEHMDEIKKMISRLVEKGYAYNVDGNVFYNVSKFKNYGSLSGKNIDDLEAGARVEVNVNKNNPLDFTLWKKVKDGEPFWESDWGRGRPGWHIECSAMSCKHLGDTFDIHAGGNDLIFPHHENEIAQSEAANNKPFVKYWLHFGFLNINNEKMSKSLGNFFTARDILSKYPAEAIRLFLLQAHYRGPLDFSDDLLDAANKGLEKINNFAETITDGLNQNKKDGVNPVYNFDTFEKRFVEAMDDDFNTPQAVAVIFDFIKEANKVIATNENLNVNFYKSLKMFFDKTAVDIFGIYHFQSSEVSGDILLENKLIEMLIDLRLKAKNAKDYSLSDEIRNKLNELGIQLKDTKGGTTYKKIK
jgi:cysteinyl-tRNA synthetase